MKRNEKEAKAVNETIFLKLFCCFIHFFLLLLLFLFSFFFPLLTFFNFCFF